MQLTKTTIFLVSIIGLASATLDVEAKRAEMEARELGDIKKRACDPNGCKCNKVKQGQYCGLCTAVTNAGSGGEWTDIFECNPDGGCCDYGPSTHCAGSNWDTWCPRP